MGFGKKRGRKEVFYGRKISGSRLPLSFMDLSYQEVLNRE